MNQTPSPTALQQLETMLDALDNGGEIDTDAVAAVVRRAASDGPTLSQTDALMLLKRMGDLTEKIQALRDDVGEQLHGIGNKRRAVRGFGHLRGHTRGQRVYKKA